VQHRQQNTRIFLDSAKPDDADKVRSILGYLDGVTAPRAPETEPGAYERSICEFIDSHRVFVQDARTARTLRTKERESDLDISVEVLSGRSAVAAAGELAQHGIVTASLSPMVRVTLPMTEAGIRAATTLCAKGDKVNMAPCVSQHQAAAVHAATQRCATDGQVVLSVPLGRLYDAGKDGVSLLESIISMYRRQKSHVGLVVTDIRSVDDIARVIAMGVDAISASADLLLDWSMSGRPRGVGQRYRTRGELIPRYDLDLSEEWRSFNLSDPLSPSATNPVAAE
jgi:hypothetical protein